MYWEKELETLPRADLEKLQRPETIARMNQGRDQTEEGQEDSSRLALPNAQTA